MLPTNLDSLTPSERTILRELLVERDQKTVARTLGLSPETVKTHLRNAREKCGTGSSFALAKAFAQHENAPPSRGIPPEGVVASGAPADINPSSLFEAAAEDRLSEELREPRAPFDFDLMSPRPAATKQHQDHPIDLGIRRVLAIAGIVFILIIMIMLAFPLSESFQRFANVIDPPAG